MNRLKNHITYFVGPIDQSKDGGRGWRKEMSPWLQSKNIGVLDPTDKPIESIDEGPNFVKYIQSKKDKGEYDTVRALMKPIVSVDLHMIDICNFVVAFIDNSIHLCGTYSELTYAAIEKKPTIIVCKQGKAGIPNWIYGLGFDHNEFFGSFEEAKDYIEDIDSGALDPPKWRLINYNKVFNK